MLINRGIIIKLSSKNTMSKIKSQVVNIISQHLNIHKNKIKSTSRIIQDLRADSLDLIEILLALEENFNIEISESMVEQFKTIQDFISYIQEYKK